MWTRKFSRVFITLFDISFLYLPTIFNSSTIDNYNEISWCIIKKQEKIQKSSGKTFFHPIYNKLQSLFIKPGKMYNFKTSQKIKDKIISKILKKSTRIYFHISQWNKIDIKKIINEIII